MWEQWEEHTFQEQGRQEGASKCLSSAHGSTRSSALSVTSSNATAAVVSKDVVDMDHLYSSATYAAAAAKSLQSCPTLCDPIDGSPSGPTVPGIFQARTLEWVAISFSNA